MLGLLLLLALIAVGVAVLFWVGGVVIQGYLYSQPAERVAVRAAASGVIVAVFFGLWCWLEGRSPGKFDTLLNFNPDRITTYDKFWTERTGDRGTQEVPYSRGRDERGRVVYFGPDGRPWQRSDGGMATAIIVEEDGERRRFEPVTRNGAFEDPLRFVEVGGKHRVMTGDALGEITTTQWGLLFGNLLLNVAHLAVWFLCLWLVMDFQWPHALGLGAALCVAFAMLVWPMLREQVPHYVG
jgi:hypothetical protein